MPSEFVRRHRNTPTTFNSLATLGAASAYFGYRNTVKPLIDRFRKNRSGLLRSPHFYRPVAAALVAGKMAPSYKKRYQTNLRGPPTSRLFKPSIPRVNPRGVYRKLVKAGSRQNPAAAFGMMKGQFRTNTGRRSVRAFRSYRKTQAKRPVRSFRRNGRAKGRKIGNILNESYKKGAVIFNEQGGFATDVYCAVIGHATCCYRVLCRTMFHAILKSLLVKMGEVVQNPGATLTRCVLNDKFNVYYRAGPGITALPLSVFSHTCGALDTIDIVGLGLFNAFLGGAVSQIQSQIVFDRIEFEPAGLSDSSPCLLQLQDAVVHFATKSDLKIQNRTTPSGGVDTDLEAVDINAQHVVGKSYFGTGNGTFTREHNASALTGAASIDLFGGPDYGIINVTPSTANAFHLTEPPPKAYFKNVATSHGIEFNPGELKKSHLYHESSMKLEKFLLLVANYLRPLNDTGVLATIQRRVGKFRFFMLEKEIETSPVSVPPPSGITLAYEINNRFGCYISHVKNNYTMASNFVQANPIN